MNKKLQFLLLMVFSGVTVFSQEKSGETSLESQEIIVSSPNPGRFSFGFNYGFGPKLDMNAGAEFEFLIFHNNKLDIRNSIQFNNYLITDEDGIEHFTENLSDKISIGWINYLGLARPYFYFEGGIGFYSNDSKKFWKTPLAYSTGFGIGLDIFVAENMSFSFDTGLLGQFFDKNAFMIQKFNFGLKYYFK
jgi:hypothetical protein